jgi:cobalt-zinc-cadmium efflux system membrane fusion protein
MSKRHRVHIFLIILLISLFMAACAQHRVPENEEKPAVQVVKAQMDSLVGSLQVRGKLEPVASSNVAPSGQGGKVESVHFDEGEPVEKGQVLITLEQDLLSSAVRQAEQNIEQAKTGLEVAKINYEKAKADYQRGKTLYEQGAIPVTVDNPMAGKGFEDYETAYKIAGQQLENAETALESAKESLVQVRENYEHAFIRSPIAGLVTRVNVNPGEMASPAGIEEGEMVVTTNMDSLREGQTVEIEN